MRKALKEKTEKYHYLFHILIGILSTGFFCNFYNIPKNSHAYFQGILGSLLPDIDHVFYWIFYAKNSKYSIIVKSLLKNRHFKAFYSFVSMNHKENIGVVSHNIFVAIAIFVLSIYFAKTHGYLAVFLFAAFMHYVFDIFEDIVHKGKLNPNWYFKFDLLGKEREFKIFK